MARTQIENLAQEIKKTLAEYTTEIEDGLKEAKKKVVKDGVVQLRKTSPKSTGNYAKGWRASEQNGSQIIHNATRPSLTHLLENGHALSGGGRTKSIKHIEPVEQKVIKDFERAVEKVIRG